MSATLPIEAQELGPQEALAMARDLMAWAHANGAGDPCVVRLEYPITVKSAGSSRTIDEVTVRRTRGGDLRKVVGMSQEDAGFALIKMLTGLMDHEIDALDGADVEAIGTLITGFRRRSPVTGSIVG